MKFYVIIPASGDGNRFSGNIPKQFFKIDGKEILAHSIGKFEKIGSIDSIIISTQVKFFPLVKKIIQKNKFKKVKFIINGGKERMDSVFNALNLINYNSSDFIIVHDAVRPYVSIKFIKKLISLTVKYKAVVPGIPVSDTIKQIDSKNNVVKTIERENLRRIQTPQVFRADILYDSFEKAYEKKFIGTDEASILEFAGYEVKVIEGEKTNIKITTKEDINNL